MMREVTREVKARERRFAAGRALKAMREVTRKTREVTAPTREAAAPAPECTPQALCGSAPHLSLKALNTRSSER